MKTVDFKTLLADFSCECGKIHRSDVKKIVMYPGALPELPSVIREMGNFESAVMICDENTYEVAGKKVEKLWSFCSVIVLDPHHLHANEIAVETVQKRLPEKMDLLVAVGSGTVHDITRYVAYHSNVPFVSVPTAASVDGYVSNVAAMTWNGAKKTMTACAPVAMVADIDIIAEAPMRLTASGVGDMLGKYTSLLDWKIGHELTGEYLCPHTVSLVEEALKNVRDGIDRLADRDREAITSLMYGLVLSGVAMQHTGISRPASGSEHHISHFIEMTIPADKCDALHGEKVGVGLVLVSRLYHRFNALSDEEIRKGLRDYKKAEDEYVAKQFETLAEEIYKENAKDCAEGITKEQILEKLDVFRALIAELPTSEQLRKLLKACGACQTLEDIGLSEEEMLPELYRKAPLVRNRLTLMRLLTCFDF